MGDGLEHLIALDAWDKCKRKMLKAGSTALRKARKEETRVRQALKKAWLKRAAICRGSNANSTKHKANLARERMAREKYQWELCKVGNTKKEFAEVRAIKYKGKCNTHFLRPSFLRRSKTRVSNMTVDGSDNAKADRTSNTAVMADNFYKFYKKLYEEREIDQGTLDRLLEKVDLTIPEQLLRKLKRAATPKELEKAMATLPQGKAAGPDGLLYAVCP